MKKKEKKLFGLGVGLIFGAGVIFGAGMAYILSH